MLVFGRVHHPRNKALLQIEKDAFLLEAKKKQILTFPLTKIPSTYHDINNMYIHIAHIYIYVYIYIYLYNMDMFLYNRF